MSTTKWGPHSGWVVGGVLTIAFALAAVMAIFTVTSVMVASTPVPVAVRTVTAPVCLGYVGLTYDDGPTAVTPALAQSLADHGLHATFFEIGYKVRDNPEWSRTVRQHGFEIGVHTWDHPRLTDLDPGVVAWQIRITIQTIQDATGFTPTLFRPPYGATNQAIRDEAARQGLTEVIWTADANDWVDGETALQTDDMIAKMKSGDVILMHDQDEKSVQTVALIARTLAAKDLCTGRIVASDTPVYVWEGLTYNAAVVPWEKP